MAVSGYQDWVAHNAAVIKDRLNLFVKEKKIELVAKLQEVGDVVVNYVNTGFMPQSLQPGGNNQFPIWTANLRDATGVGIYVDGVAKRYLPTKLAIHKQSTGGALGMRRNIDGHDFLQQSITEGASVFSKGVWIVLYCAVPYAAMINTSGSKWDRGVGFWNMTKQEFTEEVLSRLTQVAPSMYSFKV